jgi:excisionase family DNA binding protein
VNRRRWPEQLEGSPKIRNCCGAVQKDWRPRNCCAAQSPQETLMTQELEELLRIPDAARLLGIKQKTLRDWVWRRKITFIRVGKGIAFRPSDLREFIEKNVVRRSDPK